MPNELEQLQTRVAFLEGIIFKLTKSDRFIFERDIEMADGRGIQLSTATGTKIGTGTSQKLGFYNRTPVVQPSSTGETTGLDIVAGTNLTDTTTFTGGTGAVAYRVNDIIKHLKNLGLIAN
mgnify:CR=1 FL=1